MEELVALSISAKDYDPDKSRQLMSWCQKHGADEWTITATNARGREQDWPECLNEAIKPFRLPGAKRRSLSAQRPISHNNFIRPTELCRLNSKSLSVLDELLPDGLFTYKVSGDGGVEDPIFYRRGEFMLGVVSHEHEGIVRVTKAEQRLLEAEGFKFRRRGSYVGY